MMDDDNYSVTRAYLIFVTDITGGGCGEQFCDVKKFQIKRENCTFSQKDHFV